MSQTGALPEQSPFARLAVTHALAIGADTLVAVALAGSIFFSATLADARPKVLLYLAITMVPFAVLAPVMGPALDRTKGGRRFMVAVFALGRALLCVFMANHLESLLFYPAAFGTLALSKGYQVAKSSLVPAVVDDESELVEANSRLALIAVLAGVVLGPLGAGIQTLTDARWVLRLAAMVNLVSVVAAFRIPRAARTAPPAQPIEQAELHAASIRLAATAMAVLRAAVGFLTFLAAFELKRTHAKPWLFGLVIGAGALGGFLGALVAPRLRRAVREETILVGSLLMPAVVAVFGARAFGHTAIGVVACAVSVGAAAGRLAFDSLVQRDAPEAARGRTFAKFETRFQLAWVGGAFIPAAIPGNWGRLGFLLLAVGLAFFGLSYFAAGRAGRSTSAEIAPH
jgi:MFS-type transporter involved in bile tolerance (Atg22 family)